MFDRWGNGGALRRNKGREQGAETMVHSLILACPFVGPLHHTEGRGPLEPPGLWPFCPLEGTSVLQFSLVLGPAWKSVKFGESQGLRSADYFLAPLKSLPAQMWLSFPRTFYSQIWPHHCQGELWGGWVLAGAWGLGLLWGMLGSALIGVAFPRSLHLTMAFFSRARTSWT